MKIKNIDIGDRIGRYALEEVLNDEKRITKKLYIIPGENTHIAYVFYEEAEEQLNKEKEELGKLDKVAIGLEKDEAYKDLKNETQRTIYILQKHNIPSSQAKKTIELVNMRKILQEAGKQMPATYYNQMDRIDTEKAIFFVEHIENHLRDLKIDGKVICKICGKTIDEIYEEEEKHE